MISFDETWYLHAYPEVQRELEGGGWISAEAHYHQRGSREGKSPSRNFDEPWYRRTYPDVAEKISAGVYRSGLHHYLASGSLERRSPNAVFDEQWYLRSNPDVAAVIVEGHLHCGFEHFLRSGEFEGRQPNGSLSQRQPGPVVFSPNVVEDLFPFRLHVRNDPSKGSSPRLNLILPSLKMEHMSGGPNTALTLVSELSRSGVPIRLVAVDRSLDSDPQKLMAHIAGLSGGHSQTDVEVADASNPDAPALIGSNDIFFATAWWTAQMVAESSA